MERIINGTYRILNEIGRGGMSTVYRAEHVRLKTVWAIKQVEKKPGAEFNFLAESDILKNLNHPMLPRIVDILEDNRNVYIIEDYVEGITLQKLLEQQKVIPEATLLPWFKSLCGVLQYLHSQKPNPIIYRDMKPSNIMLQPDGSLKLIDFGIARAYKKESKGDTTFAGTHGYAAPEQFGRSQSDARTDIYSLGVTMYHLATGKSPLDPPYTFVKARQLNPHLSVGLETILDRCIQPEPENRYQNVTELLQDLNGIQKFDEKYQRYLRRQRGRRIRNIVLGILAAGLLIGGWLVDQEEADSRYRQLVAQADASSSASDALTLLAEAEKLDAKATAAYDVQAKVYYQNSEYQQAIDLINDLESQKLITLAANPGLYLTRASSEFELSEYEAAAAHFKAVADTGNESFNETSRLDYAVSLIRMGDTASAEQILNQAYSGDSQSQKEYIQGELDAIQGQYREAETSFLAVIQAGDDASLIRRAYISLAETYRDSAKLKTSDAEYIADANTKTIEAISQAQASYNMSGNAVLWEMEGSAYYNRGTLEKHNDVDDLKAAADCFRHCLDLGVQKDYLYINIFVADQAAGDYTAAQAILDEMKTAYPDSYEPYAYGAMLKIMIENQKDQSSRNYMPAYQDYQTAAAKAASTNQEDISALQQLEGLIQQLKSGGWIN